MKFSLFSFGSLALIALAAAPPTSALSADPTPAERGRQIVMHQSLNPGIWSQNAYDNLWKQWGVAEKPANYAEAVNQRYGLHTAPFDNHGLPMGLMQAKRLLGKGIVNNCLLCHAGTVAGQAIVMRMANSSASICGDFSGFRRGADESRTSIPVPIQLRSRRHRSTQSSNLLALEFRGRRAKRSGPNQSSSCNKGVSSDPPA